MRSANPCVEHNTLRCHGRGVGGSNPSPASSEFAVDSLQKTAYPGMWHNWRCLAAIKSTVSSRLLRGPQKQHIAKYRVGVLSLIRRSNRLKTPFPCYLIRQTFEANLDIAVDCRTVNNRLLGK